VDIALNCDSGPVLLKDIAKRQDISAQYLEHLVAPLIRAGILRSIRGAKGGIALAKPPEEVSLSRVIEILEGSVAPVECVDNPALCARADTCVTRDVWSDIKAAIMGVLESLTLKDLMDRQRAKAPSKSGAYSI
jgi:Rrf2 family cysteine metabolism transcriptional repressor